jgi:hypothetical protein
MEFIIPTVGSSGFFELSAPFDTKLLPGERYTCQAVRKISDYISNNEDVFATVYEANGLSSNEYDEDVVNDTFIISLQAAIGHWLYVPVRWVATFAITNGIPYRALVISAALPPLPATRDLSFLEQDIRNLIKDALGVDSITKLTETTRVSLISKEQHDLTQAARDLEASGRVTDRSRYMEASTRLTQALLKITELETYIKNNMI